MEQLIRTKQKLVMQFEHHKKNTKLSEEERAKMVRNWEANIREIDEEIREYEEQEQFREALERARASLSPEPETTKSRKRKGKPEGSDPESGKDTKAQEGRKKKAIKTAKQEYIEAREKRPPQEEWTPVDALLHKCEDLAFFLKDAIDASPFRTEEFKESIVLARKHRATIDDGHKKRLEDVERRIRALEEENKLLKENKETEALRKRLADAERRTRVLEWENKSLRNTKEQETKITKITNETKATNTESEPNELALKVTRIEQAIQSLLKREQAAPPATASYAQIAKSTKPRNPKPREPTKVPHRHVATIYPKEGKTDLSSEGTRDALLKSIQSTKDQSKVKSIRKIQKGGVLVETATREDLDKLLQNKKLNTAGYQTGVPAKKKPKIVFYNTPKELTGEQLMTALRKNSFTEEEIKGIKPLFQTKNTRNWVVETTPKIRDKLVNAGRLFIEWSSCPVRDYVVASRCFRCQAFGHVAKHCRASVDTCGHCAQEGHTFKVCPNKSEKPSCVNCKRVNKPHEHSSRADECPAYKRAKQNLARKTDYGE